jgi:hypothetical protein
MAALVVLDQLPAHQIEREEMDRIKAEIRGMTKTTWRDDNRH